MGHHFSGSHGFPKTNTEPAMVTPYSLTLLNGMAQSHWTGCPVTLEMLGKTGWTGRPCRAGRPG